MTAESLFRREEFVSHSGLPLSWKIECDALTEEDWATLAVMAVEILPPFGSVIGIPRGGLPFADALREHVTEGERGLIADDVWTTGGSMREAWHAYTGSTGNVLGVVAFARGPIVGEPWVTPVFSITPPRAR